MSPSDLASSSPEEERTNTIGLDGRKVLDLSATKAVEPRFGCLCCVEPLAEELLGLGDFSVPLA